MARRPQATISHKAIIDQTSVDGAHSAPRGTAACADARTARRGPKRRGHCQKRNGGATCEIRDKIEVSGKRLGRSNGESGRSFRERWPIGETGVAAPWPPYDCLAAIWTS